MTRPLVSSAGRRGQSKQVQPIHSTLLPSLAPIPPISQSRDICKNREEGARAKDVKQAPIPVWRVFDLTALINVHYVPGPSSEAHRDSCAAALRRRYCNDGVSRCRELGRAPLISVVRLRPLAGDALKAAWKRSRSSLHRSSGPGTQPPASRSSRWFGLGWFAGRKRGEIHQMHSLVDKESPAPLLFCSLPNS